jgi:hypothetical protein
MAMFVQETIVSAASILTCGQIVHDLDPGP